MPVTNKTKSVKSSNKQLRIAKLEAFFKMCQSHTAGVYLSKFEETYYSELENVHKSYFNIDLILFVTSIYKK